MIYIGIDPGAKGGYAILANDIEPYVRPWHDMAFISAMVMVTKMREGGKPAKAIVAVEKVGAMPGQGVTSMFSFGQSYGFIQGVLTALGIPYQLVPPRKWKAEFGLLNTKKEASVDVAKRLFPGVDLMPTNRCRKESDGMSDSLLLAEYARRHFWEGYAE